MSDRKWTPGPWVAENSCVIAADGAVLTAMVLGSVSRGDDGEDYSTARLVAAAPDLYEALERWFAAMDHPDIPGVPGSPLEQARAALAKARGEV